MILVDDRIWVKEEMQGGSVFVLARRPARIRSASQGELVRTGHQAACALAIRAPSEGPISTYGAGQLYLS
jgi:hypothetical protein